MSPTCPQLLQTVLDTPDPRGLAEFYRELLGLRYREGDEPGASDESDTGAGEDADWLVLTRADARPVLAFQRCEQLRPTTWPRPDVPMQMHLDMTVADRAELEAVRSRALGLGARPVSDQSDDEEEPLYVFADPAGHPFCVFVSRRPDAGVG